MPVRFQPVLNPDSVMQKVKDGTHQALQRNGEMLDAVTLAEKHAAEVSIKKENNEQ